MNTLAAIDSGDFLILGAVVAGILGFFYTVIQVGDRLWRQRSNGKTVSLPQVLHQTAECKFEHSTLLESNKRLESAIERMTVAQAALLETVKLQVEVAKLRHEEILREIINK